MLSSDEASRRPQDGRRRARPSRVAEWKENENEMINRGKSTVLEYHFNQ